jgi:uncharacterized membrane protein YadS
MTMATAVAADNVSERRLGTVGNEDWWAVVVGLAVVILGLIDYALGTGVIKFLAVSPAGMKWAAGGDIAVHFAKLWPNYLAQFVVLAFVFGGSLRLMGRPLGEFLPSFVLLYLGMLIVSTLAGWKDAGYYNLEAALIALVGGLALANVVKIPQRLKAALRVEFYVKTGIVLLGATFPISLIVSAGGVALSQSAIISVLTAAIIFFTATRVFGLDRRFAAVLGTGGSVCGVSASLAVAASVGARKDDIAASVTLVVVAAIVMVVFLPYASHWLALPAGVGGAWIGSSEFADAAGYAAASVFGHLSGNEAGSLRAFTMNKVIGRDIWIGVWSLFWAFVALRYWEDRGKGRRIDPAELWRRFPKFVIGFFIATAIVSLYFGDAITPQQTADFLRPIGSLRGIVFTLCFLAIGLTTRFSELESVNWRAALAFASGAVVNVIAGYLLSAQVFHGYWAKF